MNHRAPLPGTDLMQFQHGRVTVRKNILYVGWLLLVNADSDVLLRLPDRLHQRKIVLC